MNVILLLNIQKSALESFKSFEGLIPLSFAGSQLIVEVVDGVSWSLSNLALFT